MEASADRVVVAKRRPLRYGPVITFSGIEGSKKTVMSIEAADLLKKRGWKVKMLRSYPLSLYLPYEVDERNQSDNVTASLPVTTGFAGFAYRMFARLVFLTQVGLLWLTLRTRSGRGTAIVFDRYAHDALVQLKHTGVLGDREFIFLAGFIPSSDAAFWLRTKPDAVASGLSPSKLLDLEKKTDLYAKIAGKADFHVIDTDNEKRARDEVRGILAYLERDW